MRVSRKLQLVLMTLGSFLLLTVLIFGGLTQLARWGESEHDVYPWRSEDYLRYLVPSLHVGEAPRMLLAGPSETREDLVHQVLEEAFPGTSVYQGGQSLGKLEELLLTLDYLELAHGTDAIPDLLVLGLTPRFISNLPDDSSPLAASIDRYSPYFYTEPALDGPHLVQKTAWEGMRSRMQFVPKQGARYRAALAGLARQALGDTTDYRNYTEVFDRLRAAQSQAPSVGFMPLLSYAREVGLRPALAHTTRLFTSPYRYHHLSVIDPEEIDAWLRHPESFWYDVHRWDPSEEADRVRLELGRLLEFAERHNIGIFAVNLPEHPLNRALYDPDAYAAYLDLVRTALPGVPLLDLHDAVESEGFYDAGHLDLRSAVWVTEHVADFIQARCHTPACRLN